MSNTISVYPLNVPAPFPAETNITRSAGILHRSAITAVDKLAVPTVGAASAITEAGSTLANSAMNYTVAAGNKWGNTTAAVAQTITPALNKGVRFAITQVAGADYYDIFLSTDAAPLWVGRITEAQRAAGGFIISTVGTVTANAGTPAGSIDIGIVGTGVASTAAPFNANFALTPATPTPIVMTGYSHAFIFSKISVTDLRSLPNAGIVPFIQNANGDWAIAAVSQVLAPLSAAGIGLLRQTVLSNNGGPANLVVLVDSISGQGTAVDIWVELS